jgi:hypothetical protein
VRSPRALVGLRRRLLVVHRAPTPAPTLSELLNGRQARRPGASHGPDRALASPGSCAVRQSLVDDRYRVDPSANDLDDTSSLLQSRPRDHEPSLPLRSATASDPQSTSAPGSSLTRPGVRGSESSRGGAIRGRRRARPRVDRRRASAGRPALPGLVQHRSQPTGWSASAHRRERRRRRCGFPPWRSTICSQFAQYPGFDLGQRGSDPGVRSGPA